jgi:SecD/SecF fusion protein
MTSDDLVITALSESNPAPPAVEPSAADRADADRLLRRILADATAPPPSPRRRRRWAALVPVTSLLVVLVVAAVFVRIGGSHRGVSPGRDAFSVTFVAQATPQTPRVTPAAMRREASAVRRRLGSVPGRFNVVVSGDRLLVTSSTAPAGGEARVVRVVSEAAQLNLYDWEADVLTANGKTAAAQLAAGASAALAVSQGEASGPGGADAGSGALPLYEAVRLASRQPTAPLSPRLTRLGPAYYLFGAPGSSACAAAARAAGTAPVPGVHCLLAGPDDITSGIASDLPLGVAASEGRLLTVRQGTVVLQTAAPGGRDQTPSADPAARFYVLRDDVAVRGVDVTDPAQSTDQSGAPDVTFSFTPTGRREFGSLTAEVARRGRRVSRAGGQLDQHFAITLDDQLMTVPSIDFRQYPTGISGDGGADVTGGLTVRRARTLVTELRYGALPLSLRVLR